MSTLKSGALLQGGKYRIEKTLGQGGFGITYLAEQTNLGRKVCIKEFFMKEYGERTGAPHSNSEETVLTGKAPLSFGPTQDTSATVLTSVKAITTGAAEIMGRYQEKFVKEARTIARFDHPGIVRIHDVFEENGTAYYVMDYIEGENLNEMVKREGPLSEERALGYIRQVADALSYIHGQNIMHLDVKPSNILVRKSDDKAILIDFGASKRYDSTGTQTSTTPIGLSAGYAPIELMKVGGVSTFSPETDVYSLGATLYYLVTGQNPPDASERMEMLMEGETMAFPESVSPAITAAIDKTLQSRKNRPKSVTEFLKMLPAIKETPAQEKKRSGFCANCGEKLSLTAKFCPNCGSPVLPVVPSGKDVVSDLQRSSAVLSSGQLYSSGGLVSDDIFKNMAGGSVLEGSQEEAKPTFSIVNLYYKCNDKDDVTFTIEVEMGSEKKLTAFVGFALDEDTPIMLDGDKSTPFGGKLVFTKRGRGKIVTESISFDFSNSELVQRIDDEMIRFYLGVVLSKHNNSTAEFDDDLYYVWRFRIKHISHFFRHDEWKNLKLLEEM